MASKTARGVGKKLPMAFLRSASIDAAETLTGSEFVGCVCASIGLTLLLSFAGVLLCWPLKGLTVYLRNINVSSMCYHFIGLVNTALYCSFTDQAIWYYNQFGIGLSTTGGSSLRLQHSLLSCRWRSTLSVHFLFVLPMDSIGRFSTSE